MLIRLDTPHCYDICINKLDQRVLDVHLPYHRFVEYAHNNTRNVLKKG